ncbi:MAG: hypothetical protein CTY34_10310 [Methylobacter sp.]|nr:MAG: hypothetical protein CTY34_10310 [Methylobacter sp.]PPD17725.1 MAG: hypothetical protein CTY24_14375 [Methylobacter sp.]
MPPEQLPLRDIHLPGADSWFSDLIAWWPPAIGWWLLLAGVIFGIWLIKHWLSPSPVKSARRLLKDMTQHSQLTPEQKLNALAILTRRVAMATDGRQHTAALTGSAWLEYLDRTGKTTAFSSGIGRFLGDAHYQPAGISAAELKQLVDLCETWLNLQSKRKP